MKKLTKILVAVSYLLSCSCGGQNQENIQDIGENPDIHIIDVDKAEKVEMMFLSDICSQIKTIILETNDDVLLGKVGIVQAYKDLIFVSDMSKHPGLYAFNREGKFIRKYGDRGGGPGEYLSVRDFTIDRENEFVYLLDSEMDQILKYEIVTGKYAGKIIVKNNKLNFLFLQYSNGRLYGAGDYYNESVNSCMVHEIDMTTGKISRCWLDTKHYNKGWNGAGMRLQESFFYARHQEAFKYVHLFMDTIISFGKDQVTPYVVFKDKDWISARRISQIIENQKKSEYDGFYRELRNYEITYNINGYVEWNDFICFKYQKKDADYFVLHNIKTGNTRIANFLMNDLDGFAQLRIVNNLICSDENGLYELIDGMNGWLLERFLEQAKEDGYLKKSLDRYEELRNLPEDTNPIIFYYEFKRDEKRQ